MYLLFWMIVVICFNSSPAKLSRAFCILLYNSAISYEIVPSDSMTNTQSNSRCTCSVVSLLYLSLFDSKSDRDRIRRVFERVYVDEAFFRKNKDIDSLLLIILVRPYVSSDKSAVRRQSYRSSPKLRTSNMLFLIRICISVPYSRFPAGNSNL